MGKPAMPLPLRGSDLLGSRVRLKLALRIHELKRTGKTDAELRRMLPGLGLDGIFVDLKVLGSLYAQSPSHLRRFLEAWPRHAPPSLGVLTRLLGRGIYTMPVEVFLEALKAAVVAWRLARPVPLGETMPEDLDELYLYGRDDWLNQEGVHGEGRIRAITLWLDECEAGTTVLS